MRRVMLTAAAALLVGAASAGADDGSVRVLSDFDRPGRWRISQWSKAKGRIAIRPETAPKLADVKERKKSLGVKIAFPGGEGFRHFTLIPAAPIEPIDRRVLGFSLHLKGAKTGHYVQLNLADADGAERKVDLGRLKFDTWQKLTCRVPGSWPQPLTVKSLTFHDWNVHDPADLTIYLARLAAEVDAADAVGRMPGRWVPVGDPGRAGSWKAYQWNKAPGAVSVRDDFPKQIKPAVGRSGRSLKAEISFAAGSEFQFFQLHPAEPPKSDGRLLAAGCWLKGPASEHYIEFYFTDAKGESVKVAPSPSRLRFGGWRRVSARVPAKWAQPVRFKGIGFHNYGLGAAARIEVGLAEPDLRVASEAEIAAAAKQAAAGRKAARTRKPDPAALKPLPVTGEAVVLSDLNLPGEWRPFRWNKMAGSLRLVDDFPEKLVAAGAMKRALEMRLSFAAGRYQAYRAEPAEGRQIPYPLQQIRLWVKGTGTRHPLEIHLVDAVGKAATARPEPGRLDFEGWRQVTAGIPAGWAQPLTITGVTVANYGVKEAAAIAVRFGRLEVVINAKKKFGGEDDRLNETDDDW